MIVRDEVDFCAKAMGEFGERDDLVEGVVYAGDENVFQRKLAVFGLLIFLGGGGQFGQRILSVDGHNAIAYVIGGAVQTDGEAILAWLGGELSDLRDEAAGGDGDFSRANVGAPISIEYFQRGHQVIVVRHRLAHSHNDEVIDGAMPRPALRAFHGEHLVDNFRRFEVALKAIQPASAKGTAIRASNLRGDAQRVTIAGLAVEGGTSGDEDAFH